MFRPTTRFGRRQEPNHAARELRSSGPANTPRGIVRVPSPCLRPLTPFVTRPTAHRGFPIPQWCFTPGTSRPLRTHRSEPGLAVRIPFARPTCPPAPVRSDPVSQVSPPELGRSSRVASTRAKGALVTPQMGGTSRSERLAPYRSTSMLVSKGVGRNRTRLVQHHRSRASPRHRPVFLGGGSGLFLVRSHSQLGSAWELPRARSDGAPDRRLQPTVSISQRRPLTPRLTPSLAVPTGLGDSRFLRREVHFGGSLVVFVVCSTSSTPEDRASALPSPT